MMTKNVGLSFLFLATFLLIGCDCVIILEGGNPARFIRGTFVDVNHPEFFGSSINEKQENNFPVHESVHTLTEKVTQDLDNFDRAMIKAMKKEVEKTDAASVVNTCRFSRSRLTAMQIKNTFEAQLVQLATANVEDTINTVMGVSETIMSDAEAEFRQMIEDLQQYDETTHGKEAMTHFQNALKHFNSLQLVLSTTSD